MGLSGRVVLALLVVLQLGVQRASAEEPPAAWTGAASALVSASSAQSDGIDLSVGPGRMVLQGPISAGSASGQFSIRVVAPFRVRVTATLADVALGADGNPVRAPLGSTDWSLRGVVVLTGNAFDYRPGFDIVTFTVTVSARAPAFEQPRVGVVVVTAEQAAVDAGPAGQAQVSVLGIVITGPDAAAAPAVAAAAPLLAADGLAVSRVRWTGLDSYLADPWRRLLDHGPATLTWRYENNSDAVGETATAFRIFELGPFGWLPFVHDDGMLARAVDSAVRVVLPGQVVTEVMATDLPAASPQPAWHLPAFGVVRVTVQTTSVVAGLSAPVAEASVLLVIAPWKEILAILAGLLGLAAALLLVRAGARKVRARGQPLHPTEAHAHSPVEGIRERTAPVRTVGRSETPVSVIDEAPAAAAPDPPRGFIQGPPPKSGTPTV